MKKITIHAISAVLFLSAGFAEARSWAPAPQRPSYGGGYHEHGRRDRIEYRAQLRLRQLGYYRGRIDGDFGRGSRQALARFQRHHGLRPTGWLDGRTIRALHL